MASRVEYAVSMTPVRTIAASGDYDAHDVMANDIGKSLGGSASVATTAVGGDHVTTGYGDVTNGVPVYGNAVTGSYLELGAAEAVYKFIFIKNTGKKYDTENSTIGEAASSPPDLILYRETANGVHEEICRIPPEGALVLPKPAVTLALCFWTLKSSSADSIAVEYALIV